MSQAELPRDLTAQPAYEVTEKYWQLIRQNRGFCRALTAAIKSGRETAAGVTATVRTGEGARTSRTGDNERALRRSPGRWSVANGALVLH